MKRNYYYDSWRVMDINDVLSRLGVVNDDYELYKNLRVYWQYSCDG